jgi:hypothetical protein
VFSRTKISGDVTLEGDDRVIWMSAFLVRMGDTLLGGIRWWFTGSVMGA